MSREHVPESSEPVNAASFGTRAVRVARKVSSSTLLVSVLDENNVPVEEPVLITNVPARAERSIFLNIGLSLLPEGLVSRPVRIIYAFAFLDADEVEDIDSGVTWYHRHPSSGLN